MGTTLRAVDPCNVRLACSGLLDERAGSVAGAGYLLVRELLSRGIDIDFYAENGYTPMPESLAGPRFNYVGIERPRWMSSMPPRVLFLTIWLLAPFVQRTWENRFGPVARERHRVAPYDAVLSLGTTPRFTIPGVPTVTWLQGSAADRSRGDPTLAKTNCRRTRVTPVLRLAGRITFHVGSTTEIRWRHQTP